VVHIQHDSGRTDAELVSALQSQDEDALRALTKRFGALVLGVARKVLAEPTLAEEVAQDTFVTLWRRPKAYDPARGGLSSYLARIARNKAVDLVRKEESLKRTRDQLLEEQSSIDRTVSEPVEEMVQRKVLMDALAELSEVQKEALVLAYFGGRSYREVSEELQIPEGTAKSRLRDGLLRMRELMGDDGMKR
jgi:RNA polymerase sigma-70 factor (ECF subfamily)